MIVKLKDLRPICSKILYAIDTDNTAIEGTDILLITAKDDKLKLYVTSTDYNVEVNLDVVTDEEFDVVVDAKSFVKLISQFTRENVELSALNNALSVKCDGQYKIPYIANEDDIFGKTKITLNNVVTKTTVSSDILKGILEYNSKELSKGTVSKFIQTMYYIDEKGAITFTTGACVNSFTLDEPVKLLLKQKVVKLFKLFEDDAVTMLKADDVIGNSYNQSKIQLIGKGITVTAKISNEQGMFNAFPVELIRSRAFEQYPSCVTINKDEMLSAINRLSIFNNAMFPGCNLQFGESGIVVSNDDQSDNSELVPYAGDSNISGITYSACVGLKELKITLESCKERVIDIYFGNRAAINIVRGSVRNIIPERY